MSEENEPSSTDAAQDDSPIVTLPIERPMPALASTMKVSVRMSRELYEEIQLKAKKKHRSVSAEIVTACENWVEPKRPRWKFW